MAQPLCERITIIGLGLIGGSLARAIKEKQIASHVTACCHHKKTAKRALQLGIVDEAISNPAKAVAQSNIVILCTPLGTYETLALQFANHLSENTILTDAGSAKQTAIDQLLPHLKVENASLFVPGHPIAGSEKSGVDSGFSSLFEGKKTVLTPLSNTSNYALDTVQKLWERCGSHIELMEAQRHDFIYACVSHLPHLLSFAYLQLLSTNKQKHPKNDPYFDRFTRIAHSNIPMWRDIFFYNKQALVAAIDLFQNHLAQLQSTLNEPVKTILQLQQSQEKRLHIKLPKTPIEPFSTSDNLYTHILPKLLAWAAIETADDLHYAGTGFRDFTSGLFEMSHATEHTINEKSDVLSDIISDFSTHLQSLRQTIYNGSLKDIANVIQG